jgi:EmrB/QacA subfamily drug resistance transporter
MLNGYIWYTLHTQREEDLRARARRRQVDAEPRRRGSTADRARRAGRRRRPPGTPGGPVFAATASAGLLVSLDVSVANALLPAIGSDFGGTGRAALSWVITGYAIVFAAALVPAGRIADRAGRRRTYLGGMAVFALGSLLCALAPVLGVLLLGRVVQGLGAAAASPASLALLLAASGPRQRAVQAARWTGAAAVGLCLGPLLGGALTDLGGWRWAFLFTIPAVAGVALMARAVLPETRRHPGRRLPDPMGAGMLAAAAAALSLVLSQSTAWGAFSAPSLGALGVAIVLAWAFVRRSRRVAEPLLQLSLLRNRQVVAAALVTGCYAAGFFGFLLTFMVFAVGHWQLSVAGAGAAVLVPGAVVVALTFQVGHLAERVGYRPTLATGASIMAAALLFCATALGGNQAQARWLLVGPVLGVGIGLCYPVLAGAAVHGLSVGELASASAINQCARQLGAAVGVAASVGVLGIAPTPDLSHVHASWLLAAGCCVAAAIAATLFPSPPRASVAATATAPSTALAEEGAA